jgi:stearoyl-CoA desaturase (Delta-9 desaturase)
MTDQLAARYEGTEPFPDAGAPPRTVAGAVRTAVTLAIVIVPFAGLGVAVRLAWGHGLSLADVLLAVAFYLVTGLGVTIGFHRLLTHRSFTAAPALRVVLAIAGSMSFEGEVIGWVAIHRRHHAFSDRPGDPHSPYRYGTSLSGQLRGLAHAHIGWLLRDDPTPAARYAPDMTADPAMRAVSAAFPALCTVSLGLPFALGWAIGGWHSALTALMWAGLVRVTLLQHVTWSVNSLCHVIGARPFTTRRYDRATNLWPLALLSLGESWHNMHHSDPTCARCGSSRVSCRPASAGPAAAAPRAPLPPRRPRQPLPPHRRGAADRAVTGTMPHRPGRDRVSATSSRSRLQSPRSKARDA